MLNVSKATMALRINSPVKFPYPSGKAKKPSRDHGNDPAIVRQSLRARAPRPFVLLGADPLGRSLKHNRTALQGDFVRVTARICCVAAGKRKTGDPEPAARHAIVANVVSPATKPTRLLSEKIATLIRSRSEEG